VSHYHWHRGNVIETFEPEFSEGGKKVIVPREIWDQLIEAVEDYCLAKAMEEAEKTPLYVKEDALNYL